MSQTTTATITIHAIARNVAHTLDTLARVGQDPTLPYPAPALSCPHMPPDDLSKSSDVLEWAVRVNEWIVETAVELEQDGIDDAMLATVVHNASTSVSGLLMGLLALHTTPRSLEQAERATAIAERAVANAEQAVAIAEQAVALLDRAGVSVDEHDRDAVSTVAGVERTAQRFADYIARYSAAEGDATTTTACVEERPTPEHNTTAVAIEQVGRAFWALVACLLEPLANGFGKWYARAIERAGLNEPIVADGPTAERTPSAGGEAVDDDAVYVAAVPPVEIDAAIAALDTLGHGTRWIEPEPEPSGSEVCALCRTDAPEGVSTAEGRLCTDCATLLRNALEARDDFPDRHDLTEHALRLAQALRGYDEQTQVNGSA